jgi:hypothetical protein
MPQFTRHAYYRFLTRRSEFLAGSRDSARAQARESYMLGELITREEAMDRIRGPIRPHFNRCDYIYRADGTGPGVWISRLSRRNEVVLTYLAPPWVAWKLRLPRRFNGKRPRLTRLSGRRIRKFGLRTALKRPTASLIRR